ncbi:MAG: hypothetical protein LWX11_06600 [Firmicutes bacterium]|nr:hypothetical protein [Bacillota bacterium]
MPKFELFDLVKWLHLVSIAVGGGAMVVALLLSGLEEERPDLQGLAATLWKKVVAWSFRIAVVLGLTLWFMKFRQGLNYFVFPYFHWKLTFVVLLLAVSEMTPKMLAKFKRGAALLAIFAFLLTTFVTVNSNAFAKRPAPAPSVSLQ